MDAPTDASALAEQWALTVDWLASRQEVPPAAMAAVVAAAPPGIVSFVFHFFCAGEKTRARLGAHTRHTPWLLTWP